MEVVSKICAIIVIILCLSLLPSFISFIVLLAKKNPRRKVFGFIPLGIFAGIIVFSVVGAFADPSTYCDHQWIVKQKVVATCTENGYVLKECNLCNKIQKEKNKKLGHDFAEIERAEASVDMEGKITKKCNRCGVEEVETISKIANSTDSNSTKPSPQKQGGAYNTDNVVEGKLPPVDDTIVKELTDAGYSVEHASELQKILNTVGITSLKIKNKTGEAEKGLNAMSCYANGSTEEKSRFTLTTENGVAFYIGYLSEDLYDTEQGGFLKKYSDVHIPNTEVDFDTYNTLQGLAINEVKKYLNYPSTADFDLLSWGIGRSDDNYKIIGNVTAKNGFGVKQDINFGVWFNKSEKGFTVEGVTLNGKRVA